MGDTIRFKKGLKKNLPELGIGEPGFTINADDQRLYVGGIEGNVKIPNMTDIDIITSKMNNNTQDINNHENALVTDSSLPHGLEIKAGTFTPIVYGEVKRGNITYEIQKGSFYKINNHVWCDMHVKVSNFTDMSGNIRIGNLPYPPEGDIACGSIGSASKIILSPSYTQLTCVTIKSQCALYILEAGNQMNTLNINETHLNTSFELKISVDYNIEH